MPDQDVVSTPLPEMPEDFAAFEQYRNTGELPKAEEPAAPQDSATTEEQSSEESKPAPDSDPETKENEEQGEKKKPEGGFQRRINKLTARLHEMERLLAERSAVQPEPPKQAAPAGQPKWEDFQSAGDPLTAYTEAVAAYKVEQVLAAQQRQAEARQAEAQQRQVLSSWNERVQAAREAHPDFDDVIEEAAVAAPPALQQAIIQDPDGTELAYALAKDTKRFEAIAAMSPYAQLLALGELKAEIKASRAPKAKSPVEPLPKPPAVLGGKSAPKAPDVLDAAIDFREFERLRNAQRRR